MEKLFDNPQKIMFKEHDTRSVRIAEISERDKLEYLHNTMQMFREIGNTEFESNILKYINNRNKYLEHYKGQIVQIAQDGIYFIEETKKHTKKGLTMKVGDEISNSSESAFYSRYYDPNDIPSQYFMRLIVGHNGMQGVPDLNGLVDTGCSRTILKKECLKAIMRIDNGYEFHGERIDVVNSYQILNTGQITIAFSGEMYHNIHVYYAELPPHIDALIGTDIINRGHLNIDSGKYISFTLHREF